MLALTAQGRLAFAAALALLAAACSRSSAPSSGSPTTTSAGTSNTASSSAFCGMGFGDWCASPPGDPCGVHKNVAECRADPKCKGMPYRGESVAGCQYDDAGYATNCPTVGCISR
jgi:hypothetical protein